MQGALDHILARLFVEISLLLVLCPAAGAREVRMAVAANFLAPARVIAAQYEKEKQVKVILISSSTGKLFAQIKNGAPFDLFLAADSRRPQLLFADTLAQAPYTYAIGRVILWTSRKDLGEHIDWREALADTSIKRIALPQPETAPYGAMTQRALMREGLWQGIQGRLVYGQNVAQAFQYGASGSADLAFTALSFACSKIGENGHYWPIAEAEPVIQQGCIIRGQDEAAADDFSRFLLSDKAKAVIKKFGYARDQP